jgi:hypothetical protein
MMNKLQVIGAFVIAFCSVSLLNAQDATITVKPSEDAPTISKHIYGHFAEHLGRSIYDGFFVGKDSPIPNTDGVRNDLIEALKEIKIPNLRWPGGCFADTYHWKDGIGPQEDRPTIVNTWWGGVTEDNSFGTHDFLNLCEVLETEPYLAGNVGSGTVKELTSEFTTHSGDSVTFTQSPMLQSNATTGAAPTGATGDVNIMSCQEGIIMEQFMIGAGQTIIAPRMDATGLSVALDQTDTEGVEYNFGAARTNSRHAFTIGTSAAFFFEVEMNITDISAGNPFLIGFRKSEANNATYTDYTDFYGMGMNAVTSATNLTLFSELNSGGTTLQDSATAWTGGDGGTTTMRVLVSAAGVVTATIDGGAPSTPLAFTFDNADVVVPFIHLIQNADLSPVHLVSMKVGFTA